MANEDIIKQWVVDKLGEEGFSLKAGNLAKESAQQTFPALYDAMTHASKKQNGNRGAADFSFLVSGKETSNQYLILIETKETMLSMVLFGTENKFKKKLGYSLKSSLLVCLEIMNVMQ